MGETIRCFECDEGSADIAATERFECFCSTHVEDEQPDDEYQGRTLEQEIASFGAER